MRTKKVNGSARPLWLLAVLVLAISNQLWGLDRDLPHIAEIDEPTFVSIAVEMATTGNLAAANMGHPGTTLTYPLAATYWLQAQLTDDETLFQRAELMRDRLFAQDAWLYRWGRWLAGAYAVGAVALLFGLGRRLLDERAGLVAALLFMGYPGYLWQTKLVRTDSPSVFFTILALWMIWRWQDRPDWRRLLATGLVVGLTIATKYYLATLLALPAALLVWRAWQRRASGNIIGPVVGKLALLGSAAALGLGLAHPYFYLDWRATLQTVLFETRSVHPGADGFSTPGNFLWYFATALPANLSWWQVPSCLFGLGWVVYRRRWEPLLGVGFLLFYVLSISQLALHQARWLLPMLPLLALVNGLALVEAGDRLAARRGATGRWRQGLSWVPAALALLPAMLVLGQTNQRLAAGSTRVLARDWVVEHVPRQARIAYEEYSIDDMEGYNFMRAFALGGIGEDLDALQARGYGYFVVSSEMYNRFLAEPDRFAEAAAFYRQLFQEGELLQEFAPSNAHTGPTIRVYRVR